MVIPEPKRSVFRVLPPLGAVPSHSVREIDSASLALKRDVYFAIGAMAFGIRGLGRHDDDVAGCGINAIAGDNDPDAASIGSRLEIVGI